MPELPEVENIRRGLESKIVGKEISSVEILNPTCVKYNTESDFVSRLSGSKVVKVERRGKFLLLHLAKDYKLIPDILIVHLAMTGVLMYRQDNITSNLEPNVGQHQHIKLFLDGSYSEHLLFSDYRTFGSIRVVNEADFSINVPSHLKILTSLGAEPLSDTGEALFLSLIQKKKYQEKPIKQVLLDQSLISGNGNIYANEVCAAVGVSPYKLVKYFSQEQLTTLYQALVTILNRSIELGGTSFKDYRNSDGEKGSYQNELVVYNQPNCRRCGGTVFKSELDKRATYHCRQCQPL